MESEICVLKFVSLCRVENKSLIGLKSRTVLVYKPGVLVTVSLTSLTPLPTSKKTNYHFQKHVFLNKSEKMSNWCNFPFSRFLEVLQNMNVIYIATLNPCIHSRISFVFVEKWRLLVQTNAAVRGVVCYNREPCKRGWVMALCSLLFRKYWPQREDGLQNR